MSALSQIICRRGSSFVLDLNLSSQANLKINLGDFKVSMEVHAARSSLSPLVLVMNETNGRVTVNRTTQAIKFSMSSAVTNSLAAGSYHYHLILSGIFTVNGKQVSESIRIIEGRFLVTE